MHTHARRAVPCRAMPCPYRAALCRAGAPTELKDLHAFHLYGGVAADGSVWEHLLNISMGHEAAIASDGARASTRPRLYCKHAPDGRASAALLRRWAQAGALEPTGDAPTRPGWLTKRAAERTAAAARAAAATGAAATGAGAAVPAPGTLTNKKSVRHDPPEWLFCGVRCIDQLPNVRHRCQNAWPDLRRRRL
jgi:hypothetical protein